LAAIEDEKWSTIGAPVYIRGFLRTYARFLGLDSEEAVAEFNKTLPTPPPEQPAAGAHEEPIVRGRARAPSWYGSLIVWVSGAVAVLLIAFVVYNELTLRAAQAPSTQALASATASPTPGIRLAVARAIPPSANSLALVLSATSWLRVTVDGSVSMEGTFPAGTSKTFHGKNALVRIGNAGGVEVYVDGKDVGKLGKSGDVVEQTFTL
jgi:cytoskeletal protein RodZ